MMRAIKESLRNFWVGLLILPAALTAVAIGPKIGVYEGRMFPVVTNYVVTSKTPSAGVGFDILTTFDRVRKCKFTGMNLSIEISNSIYEEFSWRFIDPTEIHSRPIGNWIGNYHTDAPVTLINKPMRLIAYHQCWGPYLWETETTLVDDSPKLETTIKRAADPQDYAAPSTQPN